MNTPRYAHSCEACTWLGTEGEYDLYHCLQPALGIPTLVARFASEPGEYLSYNVALCGEPTRPLFIRAQQLATEQLFGGREGAIYYRALPDGYEVLIYKMAFTYRLVYGEQGSIGYIDAYCYHELDSALAAAAVWTGEGDPLVGWHRHINSGRRRENGDPNKESVNW